jgi:hypothetical protein
MAQQTKEKYDFQSEVFLQLLCFFERTEVRSTAHDIIEHQRANFFEDLIPEC